MNLTTKEVTLLSAKEQAFKNNKGEEIIYNKAILLDDDGNKFEMSINKEFPNITEFLTKTKINGSARIAAFIGSITISGTRITVVKLQLLDFIENKK